MGSSPLLTSATIGSGYERTSDFRMRLITWNCNMAFRNKAKYILKYNPDILVVPECEHPDKLHFNSFSAKPSGILWFGSNQNKGLGIFSFQSYKLKLLDNHNDAIKMVIPIAVSGGKAAFNLFAVWANNPKDPDGQYIEQVWKALDHYKHQVSNSKTILIGDFNSNSIWDKKHRISNHSNVVKRLKEKGIASSYHEFHKQSHGREKHPTQFMYRHKDKPYHLDYCFASKDFTANLEGVEVGKYECWKKYSDHVPLIITIKPTHGHRSK